MDYVPLLVPLLGTPTAKVSHWYVQVGDTVHEGERMVELLIPGLTIDVHAPASGRVENRLHVVGDVVSVNDTLGHIQLRGND